ncbi:MAG: Maf family protein [Clostridia bacterium]|nr:Maf family protein [Clostridia bacterium]
MSKIILASQSPRRFEILSSLGIAFSVVPSEIDESRIKASKPSSLVKKLSFAKAKAVFEEQENCIVIGSDTIVYMDSEVFGKPGTDEEAVRMIQKLSGRWHTVYTGVTIMSEKKTETYYVKSQVKFRKLSIDEIKAYVNECHPLDKAGAYGIQDNRVVEKYRGSLSNIIGLPSEGLKERLSMYGENNGSY